MRHSEEDALAAVVEDEGFEDAYSLMRAYILESVVPGACLQCLATTCSCEPDMEDGWCHNCGESAVRSCLILGGVM